MVFCIWSRPPGHLLVAPGPYGAGASLHLKSRHGLEGSLPGSSLGIRLDIGGRATDAQLALAATVLSGRFLAQQAELLHSVVLPQRDLKAQPEKLLRGVFTWCASSSSLKLRILSSSNLFLAS